MTGSRHESQTPAYTATGIAPGSHRIPSSRHLPALTAVRQTPSHDAILRSYFTISLKVLSTCQAVSSYSQYQYSLFNLW